MAVSEQLRTDQLLRLYDIEVRQVHSSLDQILKIRAMIAVAFAAILSATLFYKQSVIALGALIFLAAWYWEYIYARYMQVYKDRVGAIQVWLAGRVTFVEGLPDAYERGYDHRVVARAAKRIAGWLSRPSPSIGLVTFFDLPRATAYLALSLSPLVLAMLLGFPWP